MIITIYSMLCIDYKMSIKVVAAGLAKTGTTSMNKALHILGYSVMDWEEHFEYHYEDWMKILVDGGRPNFIEMYKPERFLNNNNNNNKIYDALCDTPTCNFVPELLEAFPNI